MIGVVPHQQSVITPACIIIFLDIQQYGCPLSIWSKQLFGCQLVYLCTNICIFVPRYSGLSRLQSEPWSCAIGLCNSVSCLWLLVMSCVYGYLHIKCIMSDQWLVMFDFLEQFHWHRTNTELKLINISTDELMNIFCKLCQMTGWCFYLML